MAGVLLDTNVLSELMRPKPAIEVMGWFDRRAKDSFFVSAVTRAEILLGIALLPEGRRRDGLAAAAEQMFARDFTDRCLPFDDAAATEYALIVAARSRAGHVVSTEDAQIAAIALANGLALAIRTLKDFKGIDGLSVLDPWSER